MTMTADACAVFAQVYATLLVALAFSAIRKTGHGLIATLLANLVKWFGALCGVGATSLALIFVAFDEPAGEFGFWAICLPGLVLVLAICVAILEWDAESSLAFRRPGHTLRHPENPEER